MRIRLTHDIDVLDEQGNVRLTHSRDSVHDWGIAEAAAYVEAEFAVPADEDARAHYEKWKAMSEDQRAKFVKPDRTLTLTESGRAVESVA